jgi:hypothetical protein
LRRRSVLPISASGLDEAILFGVLLVSIAPDLLMRKGGT